MNLDISNSAKFMDDYNCLLQKVKKRWFGGLAENIGISESKASRILTGKQFDIITFIEIASICGYDCKFNYNERY